MYRKLLSFVCTATKVHSLVIDSRACNISFPSFQSIFVFWEKVQDILNLPPTTVISFLLELAKTLSVTGGLRSLESIFAYIVLMMFSCCSSQTLMRTSGSSVQLESFYLESMLPLWMTIWSPFQWVCLERYITYSQPTNNVEVGCLRISRSFHYWRPAPRWRPLSWMANPDYPPLNPYGKEWGWVRRKEE